MAAAQALTAAEAYRQLFLSVGEELKQPLLHIGRRAELGRLESSHAGLQEIQETADMTLRLLDSYLLSLRLGLDAEAQLAVAPVSLSSVLHDTREQLQATARHYGVTLELHVQGRYEPVLAHAEGLTNALLGLGYALIAALPASGASVQKLQLATHRSSAGLVAGIYGDVHGLTPRALRRGRELHGRVRQPLVGAAPGSSAGVFMADSILNAMQARLRVGRFNRLPGFAITLPPSRQLQLV